MTMLRERVGQIPRVVPGEPGADERLIILPDEDDDATTTAGRPIGKEYFDIDTKLKFMKTHGIEASVLSLANPWLDFLAPAEASRMATVLNAELDQICSDHPGKLFGFGVVALHDSAKAAVAELEHLAKLPHMRGVIISTSGKGAGLDDGDLEPVYAAAAKLGLTLFVHPHYGLGNEQYVGYVKSEERTLPLPLLLLLLLRPVQPQRRPLLLL